MPLEAVCPLLVASFNAGCLYVLWDVANASQRKGGLLVSGVLVVVSVLVSRSEA
jgi:hypothetical protein